MIGASFGLSGLYSYTNKNKTVKRFLFTITTNTFKLIHGLPIRSTQPLAYLGPYALKATLPFMVKWDMEKGIGKFMCDA